MRSIHLPDGKFLVTQGFDRILEDKELEKIKENMKSLIIEELLKGKKAFLEDFTSKMSVLCE